MEDKVKLIVAHLGLERVKLHEKLSGYTYSKMGGPARIFYIATNQKELILALETAFQLRVPYFCLGSGTKMLISEKGLDGLVIKNRADNIKIAGIKGKVGRAGLGVEEMRLEVDSGVSLGTLNAFLTKQNLKEIVGISSTKATLGGSLLIDPVLQASVDQIKVWYDGELFEVTPKKLKRDYIIISAILTVKAN